jgi:DNA-binding NarL/FixJ family response regulator
VESWVTRIILAPVFEHAGVDGLESGTVVAGTGLTCLEPLTQRESEVLSLLAEGLSNAGIAARLVLSKKTVEAHLRSVFRKLELPESPLDNRRVHAVRAWYLAEQGIRQAS